MKKEEVYGHIDHTLLKAFSTTEQIEAITEEALKYGTASICIPASFVNYIHNKYKDVNICTVIGFPLGYSTTPIKVAEAKQAIEDGANEIDMPRMYEKFRASRLLAGPAALRCAAICAILRVG